MDYETKIIELKDKLMAERTQFYSLLDRMLGDKFDCDADLVKCKNEILWYENDIAPEVEGKYKQKLSDLQNKVDKSEKKCD